MFKKIYNTDKVEEKNMLKKICVIGMTLCMLFGVTACGANSNSSSSGNKSSVTTKKERPFTESKGLIKYFKINDEKICLPETVGEYVSYLKKIGTKVELGDTGKSVDEADELNAGGVSSMVAFLKVYLDDDNWQWFGIRYENDTKKLLPVSECKVTQITLDYDTINEEENHYGIDSIVFVTQDDSEVPMDGKYNKYSVFGAPSQETDGHLYFYDEQGYKYEMVAENKKGILTRVAITYPTK